MSKKEENTIIQLVQLIMSSKSSEELQKQALRCLRSSPDIVLRLLKKSCTNGENKKIFDCGSSKHEVSQNQGLDDLIKNEGKNNSTNNFDNMSQERPFPKVNDNKTTDTNDTNTQKNMCDNDSCKAKTDKAEKQSKKRKSKYADIHGDLSHIQRDPKSKTIKQQTHGQTKRTKLYETSVKGNAKQTDIDENIENVQLVRSMIEMLKNPRSMQHQEFIVSCLREDRDLRKLFIEEKTKMGRQTVRVYRRSTSQDESNHFRHNPDHQSCSSAVRDTNHDQSDLCTSKFCIPCSNELEIDHLDADDKSTDALIHALLYTIDEKGTDIYQGQTTNPHSNADLRLSDPLISSNAQRLQNSQIDRIEATDALYITTEQIKGFSRSAAADNTHLPFQFEEQQTSSNLALSFNINELHGLPNTTLSLNVDDQQATSSATHTEFSTDDSIIQNAQTLDAGYNDPLQELSHDLYHFNNSKPN